MTDLFWLSHEQLERIKPYFPLSRGAQRADDLKVISGIVFVIKNGLRWRDARPRTTARTRRCTTASSAGAAWAFSTASSPSLPASSAFRGGSSSISPISKPTARLRAFLKRE